MVSKASTPREPLPEFKPATNPQARENQMISLAVDLAEQQLRAGTASAQVITHYLKQSTAKEELEREKLALSNKLLEAQTEQLASQKRVEELYSEALAAMKQYSGNG